MKNEKKDELYYIEILMRKMVSIYDRIKSCKTERNIVIQKRNFFDTFDMLEYFYNKISISYKIFHKKDYKIIGNSILDTKKMLLESFDEKEKELLVKK